MSTVTWIDPPNGWMYGFPKVLPEGVGDVRQWLVENGYPQAEIDYFSPLNCGFWTEKRPTPEELEEATKGPVIEGYDD